MAPALGPPQFCSRVQTPLTRMTVGEEEIRA